MSFNTNEGRLEYTATGGQTLFTFNFAVFDDTQIKVYQTPVGQTPDDIADLLAIITDYTVALNLDPETGGSITLVAPASNGDLLTLQRELPIDREIDYQENGDFFAQTIDEDQNYQTYLAQQNKSAGKRNISLADSEQGFSTILPGTVAQYYLRVNAAGTGLEWAAGTTSVQNEYDVLLFRLFDGTKKISFVASAITAGQTRSIIMPDSDVDLGAFAEKTNVLELNNTTPFTPTSDYHPATKKYVDDSTQGLLGALDVNNFLHIQDQKPTGTDGGTFTSGSFQTRDLNTVIANTITGASLSVNQITLPIGTYFIEGFAPAYGVNGHGARLTNITDVSLEIEGTSGHSGANVNDKSFIIGLFTIAGIKDFEVQHRSVSTGVTTGFGRSGNAGASYEAYTDIKIWKVG